MLERSITTKQNIEMTREPTEEEIKEAVFNLNKENTCGPNGFSEELFQTCHEIIKKDISLMVMVIFLWW